MNSKKLKELIIQKKIIAICRKVPADRIVDTGLALYEGGIRFMEVTFNADCEESTLDSIRQLKNELGEKIHVGAGTVTTIWQAEKAIQSGAEYIISPNTNPEVIRRTKELNVLSIPGALTPSEILTAWDAGADFVKIFPAADLGTAYIKSIRAPLNHIPLLAVGGINQYNMKDFINMGIIGFGIGSNIVNLEFIKNCEYGKLTQLALEYTSQFECEEE